jgi:hypothetical protein
MTYDAIVRTMQDHLMRTGRDNYLLEETVRVRARPLTTEEVIGDPEHEDYPLVTGREKMMEASVRGSRGQAFTDMYGHWEGTLRKICGMEPANNYRRAILVATLNAVMRAAGDIEDTVHCKDAGPVECAEQLKSFVAAEALRPPFVLIGYQPRSAENLAQLGELRIVDGDPQHIGEERAGTTVMDPDQTGEALNGAESAFVTGSTLVNGTIQRFLDLDIPTVFYGVTIAGAAQLLNLKRYCPTST